MQFENQKTDKTGTAVRIIIHATAIQDIFEHKQFNGIVTQTIFNEFINSEETTPTDDLLVTKEERIDLLNKLLENLPISERTYLYLKRQSDLKKANCMCAVHQMNREVNLLCELQLPNTLENRTVIKQGLKFMPHGFTSFVSSCQQTTGSDCDCALIKYDIIPNGDGTFRVEQLAYYEQPHDAIKSTYIDFSEQSFVYVCQDEDEQHTIGNLFDQLKRSTEMDVCSSTLMDGHTSDGEEDVPVMDTFSYQCSLI